MRWFWIDRFTELVSGVRATSVKNVSLAEDHLHDHFKGCPIMPNSLIVEGMAQTGGILVNEWSDFRERVVLAKLARSRFHFPAAPGDTLTYRSEIIQLGQDGAMVSATSHVGERLQADADMFFAHLDVDHRAGESLFEPEDFLNWLKILKVFEVGRKEDGSPIKIPPHLASSETAAGGNAKGAEFAANRGSKP
ncbi:MAG: 3-hydroxyacyl-ACP dehydratase FabZ family protein [Pirellulales bacterium]